MTDTQTQQRERELRLVHDDERGGDLASPAQTPAYTPPAQTPAYTPQVGGSWRTYAKPLLMEAGISGATGALIAGVASAKKTRVKHAALGGMLGVGLQGLTRAGFGGVPQALRIGVGVVGALLTGGALFLALREPAKPERSGVGRARAVRQVAEQAAAKHAKPKGRPKSKARPKPKAKAPVRRRKAPAFFDEED